MGDAAFARWPRCPWWFPRSLWSPGLVAAPRAYAGYRSPCTCARAGNGGVQLPGEGDGFAVVGCHLCVANRPREEARPKRPGSGRRVSASVQQQRPTQCRCLELSRMQLLWSRGAVDGVTTPKPNQPLLLGGNG